MKDFIWCNRTTTVIQVSFEYRKMNLNGASQKQDF